MGRKDEPVKILIKNGRVLDPASRTDGIMDLLIEDERIVKAAPRIAHEADRVVDAEGCWVMPGLIDIHVHLREPGFEHKETIKTGAMAAAKGGFTTICPMPNTKPVTDSPEMIRWVIEKARAEAPINVLPVGAVTIGQMGEELADIEGMAKAGAIGISEDGKSVMNAALYAKAMEKARDCGIVVMAHCEDKNLVGRGVMQKCEKAEELGLEGISNAVEDVIVARDILLAKETGARLHLCHCSTADSVVLTKLAKDQGLPVTAEVCPHHFTLTADDIKEDDGNYKMNPPLRGKADVQALKEGLRDDVMDVISTDHAPHSAEEKNKSMKLALFGIVGSETSVALTITEMVKTGYLTPLQMADKMSYQPAKVLGIDKGTLAEGKIADITIIDPDAEYVIDPEKFVSMGKNTPFGGKKVSGRVLMTICGGKVVYEY